jgi:hypothetical protein
MPRGFRQVALSISFLSPIVRRPDAFAVTKIASLIFRPEQRFLALTSFQRLTRPSLSFGSSSLISLCRQSLALSRARLRPPGNIQSPSRFRLTSSTRPRFAATSFEDFAIPKKHHLSTHPDDFNGPLSESSIRSKTQRRPPRLAAVRPSHHVPSGTSCAQVPTFFFVHFVPEQIPVLPGSAILNIGRHTRTVILLVQYETQGQVNSNGE